MYFEFGRTLQAGLDCAGGIDADQAAVLGWVRHRAGAALDLRVEASPGEVVETIVLDLHPRHDVEVSDGMAVTGFSLVHAVSPDHQGRLLIIGFHESAMSTLGEEVAIDLLAYEIPDDVPGLTLKRDWGANYRLLHAWAAASSRGQGTGLTGPATVFGDWMDRLPRFVGAADWFMDFRAVSAVILPNGEIALSGALNLPGGPEGPVQAMACVIARGADGTAAVLPVAGESHAAMEGGFALFGQVGPQAGAVEAVVQVCRGEQAWWFRAEVAPAGIPGLLATLSLSGTEPSATDSHVLQGWMRRVLMARAEGLQGALAGMALSGDAAPPGGTALLFDVNDEYAARVLSLLAPQLEARFDRIVLSGAAAGRAATALMRRGRLDVLLESGAEEALATAMRAGGSVAPIDTASLVDAAIEGDPARLTANALPADRLPMITALHAVAGTGPMETTIRRVVAMMAGVDPAALPLPAQRPDPIGNLMSEHLRGLWEMVPVAGTPR